jgi:hypothetical protein
MSSVVISGDTSGAITLSAPAVAGTNTATLPAATGTVMVSGNMPAFSAYTGSSQSVSNSTWTKIQFNNKYFDTNTNYSTVNYRFTPTVAGYYQLNGGCTLTGSGTTGGVQIALVINGGTYYRGNRLPCVASQDIQAVVSNLIYFNGSTDYVELSIYQFSGVTLSTDQNNCYFSGVLIRN